MYKYIDSYLVYSRDYYFIFKNKINKFIMLYLNFL